jgi:hypothetical protein
MFGPGLIMGVELEIRLPASHNVSEDEDAPHLEVRRCAVMEASPSWSYRLADRGTMSLRPRRPVGAHVRRYN